MPKIQHFTWPRFSATRVQVSLRNACCKASNSDLSPTGEVLIKAGAELMARNNVGIMPIHAASLGGHTSMGKLLLENGLNVFHHPNCACEPAKTSALYF